MMVEGFHLQSGVPVRRMMEASPLFAKKPNKKQPKKPERTLQKLFNDNFLLGKPQFNWSTGKPVDPKTDRKVNWLYKPDAADTKKKGGKK